MGLRNYRLGTMCGINNIYIYIYIYIYINYIYIYIYIYMFRYQTSMGKTKPAWLESCVSTDPIKPYKVRHLIIALAHVSHVANGKYRSFDTVAFTGIVRH